MSKSNAMRMLRRKQPLSQDDFIEHEDLHQLNEPIDQLALVFDYQIRRLEEIEKKIKKGKHQTQPEQRKPKFEQLSSVSSSDHHHPMATRGSANSKGKGKELLTVDADWKFQIQLALSDGTSFFVNKGLRLKIRKPSAKRKSVVNDEDLELRIRRDRAKGKSVVNDEDLELRIRRDRAKGKSVVNDEDLEFRIRRDRAKGKNVADVDETEIGECSSGRLLHLEDTIESMEMMEIGEQGSSNRLLEDQVTSASSRKRSNYQTKKKPDKKPRFEVVIPGPPPPPLEEVVIPGPPPPPLPAFFHERISALGGVNPVLVIQKALFQTDLKAQQNRLSIPLRAMMTNFLTDGEMEFLSTTYEKRGCNVIDTVFLDTRGKQWVMPLRLWDMKKGPGTKSSRMCVLTNPWIKMAKDDNGLAVGDVVQLWAFRVGEEEGLGFALVKLGGEIVDGQ